MDSKEILRKAALLKRNPQLANVIPNSEIISLLSDVLTAFSTLQKAVESNKLKGDKGERGDDAIAPIAGQDYPSFEQVDTYLSQAVKNFTDEYTKFQKEAKAVIERASKLENGKDAEITEELIEEIAENAFSLIELPDFDELVDTRITASPQAIRDALELLQGDERLDASAIKGLERFIKTVQVNGGTIGKGQVLNFLFSVIDYTPSNNNAVIQYSVADGKYKAGHSITVSTTAPTDPKYGDIWFDVS